MNTEWTPLAQLNERERDAATKAALDKGFSNPVTRRRAEELIAELSEGLDRLNGSELAARTAAIWRLREANRS
jgi:hypothetical protein